MRSTFSMIAMLLMPSIAFAHSEGDQKPVTPGEMYDQQTGASTAYTLEKGEVAYHPVFKNSAVGITNNLDLKFPTLGIIVGPKLGLEYALVQNDNVALSLEPAFRADWTFQTWAGGGMLRFTKGLGDHRLNLGVGGQYGALRYKTTVTEDVTDTSLEVGPEIPIDVGFDMVSTDLTVLTFSAHIRTLSLIEGSGILAIPHIGLTQGIGKKFRMALGLNCPIGGLPQELLDSMSNIGIDLPKTVPIALPHFQLWWKF